MKGVILTKPEYRLSFQLKFYESVGKEDHEMANGLSNILKMTNENVRNILDESDAILHPKYQIIYTVGNQLPPDGGPLRWQIAQAVLKRVPYHMKRLWTEYGSEKIELCIDEKYTDRDDVFPPCRILDESMFERLKSYLIDDFLEGRLDIDFQRVVAATKNALRSLVSHKVLDSAESEALIKNFSTSEQNTIRILIGFFRYKVLKLALMRRWRVNYGVSPEGRRKMAVPFRAKDDPAEMAEFGHSDIAILFTQLSYYYSGNSDVRIKLLLLHIL